MKGIKKCQGSWIKTLQNLTCDIQKEANSYAFSTPYRYANSHACFPFLYFNPFFYILSHCDEEKFFKFLKEENQDCMSRVLLKLYNFYALFLCSALYLEAIIKIFLFRLYFSFLLNIYDKIILNELFVHWGPNC